MGERKMGSSQRIIIDGYNVIYTDERLRRTACRDLQKAREALIDRLRAYLSGRQLRVTLVFDGRGGMIEAESVVPHKLQVLYSASGQSADDVIINTIRDSGNPRGFIVVTSDNADIGRVVRPLGCEVIGSMSFLRRIASPPHQGKAPKHDTPDSELGDTDYWLRQFGADEPDADT
jgi:predicted RNA-binding protein with PIN domain